jgi:hypothetical protein
MFHISFRVLIFKTLPRGRTRVDLLSGNRLYFQGFGHAFVDIEFIPENYVQSIVAIDRLQSNVINLTKLSV